VDGVETAAFDPGEHWERVAPDWIAWTRTPGHDAFWSYREGFRAFVPPPGEATLEVGCGEGRISRELADLGHRVTALDLSPRCSPPRATPPRRSPARVLPRSSAATPSTCRSPTTPSTASSPTTC
jgi:SAM-dependent methyltransferase